MAHFGAMARYFLVFFLLGGLFAGALTATVIPAHAASPGDVVISEFRTRGPNGATDDFVELYNRTALPINMSGWKVEAATGLGSIDLLPLVTFSSNFTLQSGQHFLAVGPRYSGLVPADATFIQSIADDGGIALIDPNNAVPIDQVGMSIDSAFHEPEIVDPSEILSPLSTDADQSYERKDGGLSDSCVDTDNNPHDFSLISPSDPQNLSSPLRLCGAPLSTLTPSATPTISPTPTITLTPTNTISPADTAAPSATSAFYNPSVIINEIDWAGTSADSTAQWIELYNNQTYPINLNGWILAGQYGYPSINLNGVIPARGYYLLVHGSNTQATTTPTPGPCVVFNPADVTYDQIFTGGLYTYGQTLYLKDPNNFTMDTANLYSSKWPAGSTTKHASMERRGVVPDSSDAWITYAATTGTVRDCANNLVYGTPKNQNWAWGKAQTPSPTPAPTKKPTPRPPTPFAHVVINEFLPRPGFDWNNDSAVNDYDEFIEIENLGPINVNLSGWKLDNVSNGGSHFYSLPGRTLSSGDRAVYYGSVTKIPLYDSGGTVRLINSRGVVVDARGYDAVKYPDQSTCRLPDGDGYWTVPCFPSPGLENARTGSVPALPPGNAASQPPACLLPDTVPEVFREPVCHPFGADIWNPGYWGDPAGQLKFPVQDIYSKWQTTVE